MTYTTFDYYSDTYYGDLVPEPSFAKYLKRATDKVSELTFGRIDQDMLDFWDDEIQSATCSLIDVLYNLDQATTQTGVKSVSSGGESITYDTDLMTPTNRNNLIYNAVRGYLGNTGLLFVGV